MAEVRVFVTRGDNELLLLRRGPSAPWWPNRWCVPGGAVDAGEHPEDAAQRELEEEVLGTRAVGMVRAVPHFNDARVYWFLYRLHPGEQIALNYEHTAYRWVSGGGPHPKPLMPSSAQGLAKLAQRVKPPR